LSKNWKEINEERKNSGIDQYIVKLDHIAYRVKMGDREKLMGELMNVLPYKLFKSFKVVRSNATTTCLKLEDTLPVVVISEGLSEDSIVEKYCQKYGSRVHHLAYLVTDIDKVVEIQKSRGVKFTTEKIIGSEEEGIKQIFTLPTETSNHIIEYIQRFGDFDGFFTPSNIAGLMKSTEKLSKT
jgi:4-hydroxyphenylpyruvate dioxygenase-like putative hemolysin